MEERGRRTLIDGMEDKKEMEERRRRTLIAVMEDKKN